MFAVLLGGAHPKRDQNRHYSIAPYASYRAADGDLIIAAANDKLFGLVCRVLDRPDLVDHPDYVTNAMRRANDDALTAEVEALFSTFHELVTGKLDPAEAQAKLGKLMVSLLLPDKNRIEASKNKLL